MRGAKAGVIHIECGFAAGGTLDYLKFWSSITRGHWFLAGEYCISPSKFHCAGVRFDNGDESERLAHILESVMQHQTEFSLPVQLRRATRFRRRADTGPKKNSIEVLSVTYGATRTA